MSSKLKHNTIEIKESIKWLVFKFLNYVLLDGQIEDLSYDMTGSILGGSNIDCIRNFVSAFIEAFQAGDFYAIPEILTEYLQCIEADSGPIV